MEKREKYFAASSYFSSLQEHRPAVQAAYGTYLAELTRASEAYWIAKSFLFAKKYPFAINSFC